MQVVVPFAVDEPKTRLAPVLEPDERAVFARAMLADVLAAIRAKGREPTVLATAALSADAPVVVDDRSLDDAVNAVLETRDVRAASEGQEGEAAAPDPDAPVAIVMADLALATPAALESLFSTDGDVVVAPGRGGGTNAFVSRHPDFRVDYHGASYLDHRRIARRVDATWRTVDSYRLSTDIDEAEDLVEVVLHGGERSRSFLEGAGFDLETSDGRVRVARDSEAGDNGRP